MFVLIIHTVLCTCIVTLHTGKVDVLYFALVHTCIIIIIKKIIIGLFTPFVVIATKLQEGQ